MRHFYSKNKFIVFLFIICHTILLVILLEAVFVIITVEQQYYLFKFIVSSNYKKHSFCTHNIINHETTIYENDSIWTMLMLSYQIPMVVFINHQLKHSLNENVSRACVLITLFWETTEVSLFEIQLRGSGLNLSFINFSNPRFSRQGKSLIDFHTADYHVAMWYISW